MKPKTVSGQCSSWQLTQCDSDSLPKQCYCFVCQMIEHLLWVSCNLRWVRCRSFRKVSTSRSTSFACSILRFELCRAKDTWETASTWIRLAPHFHRWSCSAWILLSSARNCWGQLLFAKWMRKAGERWGWRRYPGCWNCWTRRSSWQLPLSYSTSEVNGPRL